MRAVNDPCQTFHRSELAQPGNLGSLFSVGALDVGRNVAIQVATSALWCRGEAEFLPAAHLGLDLSRAKVPSYGNSTATETSKIRRGLAAPNRLALWKLAPRPGLEPGTYGLTVADNAFSGTLWDFSGRVKTITYQWVTRFCCSN